MRKKLFAVIMSAMMLITFMPTMAFAYTTDTFEVVANSWNADFSQVQITDGTKTFTVSTVREMSANGLIEATPQKDNSYLANKTIKPAYYYDMATMSLGGKLAYSQYSSKDFTNGGILSSDSIVITSSDSQTDVKFKFKKPTELEGVNGETNKLANATVSIYRPNYILTKKYEKQEFTLAVNVATATGANGVILKADGTPTKPYRINSMATKKISAQDDVDVTTVNATYFKVGKTYPTGNLIEVTYNGSEQKLEMEKLPDVTATYKLYNAESGKTEDVANPTVKNVGTYEFTAVAAKGTVKSNDISLVVKVNPAKIKVGFTVSSDGFIYVPKGQKIVARNLVKFTNNSGVAPTTEAYKSTAAVLELYNDALNKYFDACYDVKMEEKTLTITPKEGVDLNALADQYAVVKNFVFEKSFTGTLKEVDIAKNDVTARNQTKTFHVKKAKALKAKKTFNLKGDVVDYGSPIYVQKSGNSKIVVAKDGVVTVKKGLKKGTYKVQIKVKAVCTGAPSGYVTDTKTLKVKVVK